MSHFVEFILINQFGFFFPDECGGEVCWSFFFGMCLNRGIVSSPNGFCYKTLFTGRRYKCFKKVGN